MQCDICGRPHDAKRLPFLCAVDTRNQIYEGRMKHLQVLIESEGIRNELHSLLHQDSGKGGDTVEALKAQQAMSEQRTTEILDAADKLRNDIKNARDEIRSKKSEVSRRKGDLASAKDGVEKRRGKQLNEMEKSTQMLRFRWSQSAEDMASTRSFLCAEAAHLYGLKKISKKGSKNPEYQVGKVPVIDLLSMNGKSSLQSSQLHCKLTSAELTPELITASLGHISHLLSLASHYLAIRLPAEVTSPHKDYPCATIMPLSSSYRYPYLPFPGTSSTTTPTSSTISPGARNAPRPRPLAISKPLPQLLKDDPSSYAYFVEGVTLLAYNIAWLCNSQGLSIGDKSPFDEVCQMGRNLYTLLVQTPAQQPRPATEENPNTTWLGRYSHGTMFYSLAGAEGAEVIKTFKLPSPVKLADKLKRKLLGDAAGPDWEVLEDDAWKIEDIPTTDLPDGAKKPADTKGWTKVK